MSVSEFYFWGKNREQFVDGGCTLPQCPKCSLPADQHPNPACDLTEAKVLRGIVFDSAVIGFALESMTRYTGIGFRLTEREQQIKAQLDETHAFATRLHRKLIGLPEPFSLADAKKETA